MARRSKPKKKALAGKWVFVPENEEDARESREQHVHTMLSTFSSPKFEDRCKSYEQFYDYCPNDNMKLPEPGGWILVRNPPNTEYTAEPLSVWFAEPWLLEGDIVPYRVKILMPQGELGLFPSEYAIIDVNKYIGFIGEGYNVRFFSNPTGITNTAFNDKLIYIRSRGIGKAEAITMLIGEVKQHGVLWLEADESVKDVFVR